MHIVFYLFTACTCAFYTICPNSEKNMFLITTTLFLIIIILFIKYKHFYWKRKKIPYLHPNLIYGNVKTLLKSQQSVGTSIFDIHQEFRLRNVKFGGFYMLTAPALIILDPDLIKHILIKDFTYFEDRNVYTNVKKDPLSGHLFALECPRWRKLRQKITPVFSSGKIKNMHPIILQLSQKLNETLACVKSFDVKLILGCFSLDIIANCVFGIQINALQNQKSDFFIYSNRFLATTMSSNFKMAFGIFYSDILRVLNVKIMDTDIAEFFLKTFKNNFVKRLSEKNPKNDFIDLFINNVKNNDDDFDFEELSAQAFLFFIAGYETSTQTLVFCLYELSLNKRIQDKLRDEIEGLGQKIKDYETIVKMEYLDFVVSETLRKYPAAPVLNRKCTKLYKIPDSDCVIEKGTPVWISILGLHRDPKYYKDPDLFDPERFKDPKVKKSITYLPFGSGPRNCIGIRFALLQIKTTLVSLISNFEFDIDKSRTQTPIKFGPKGILLNTEQCIYLNIRKIKLNEN